MCEVRKVGDQLIALPHKVFNNEITSMLHDEVINEDSFDEKRFFRKCAYLWPIMASMSKFSAADILAQQIMHCCRNRHLLRLERNYLNAKRISFSPDNNALAYL